MSELQESMNNKVVVVREGGSLRTAAELCKQYVEDARGLLSGSTAERRKYAPSALATEIMAEDFPEEVDEDYGQILNDMADSHQMILDDAGFTTSWNDGFVIYEDLTGDEQNAIGEEAFAE